MSVHPSNRNWITTRSALFAGGQPQWEAIAAYGPAIRGYLARRYARLSDADRDDLVQDLLIEIRERLASSHQPSRGKFRQLLQTAIQHRVIDRLRRIALTPPAIDTTLHETPAPRSVDVDAIDLEVALIQSVAAVRDEFTQGRTIDRKALYTLADRVVHGRSDAAIAAAGGMSVDQVTRLLRKVRERILHHLLRRELDLGSADAALGVAVEVAREALQRPSERLRLLEEQVTDGRLREQLDEFLSRFLAAMANLPTDDPDGGSELRRSLEVLLS